MLDRADCADFGCHNSIRLETKHFLNTLALTFISFSGRFVFCYAKTLSFFCERSSSFIRILTLYMQSHVPLFTKNRLHTIFVGHLEFLREMQRYIYFRNYTSLRDGVILMKFFTCRVYAVLLSKIIFQLIFCSFSLIYCLEIEDWFKLRNSDIAKHLEVTNITPHSRGCYVCRSINLEFY